MTTHVDCDRTVDMDGADADRTTIPDAFESDLSCPHCGGTAVAMFTLGIHDPRQCAQCGHPGHIERDGTGAWAWTLDDGRCMEKCDTCSPVSYERVTTESASGVIELPGIEDGFSIPTVEELVALAEQNSLVLRCPVSFALRHLVTDIDTQLARARAKLMRNAADAANLIARKELA